MSSLEHVTDTCLTVPADCDVVAAADRLAALRVATQAARPDRPLRVDLGAGPPTAVAIQLAAAAAATLARAQAFAGFGPAAAQALGLHHQEGGLGVEDRTFRG